MPHADQNSDQPNSDQPNSDQPKHVSTNTGGPPFTSARHPHRPVVHPRPDGLDSATVEALGVLSEALEDVETARGYLYTFHRLSGRADLTLQRAVRQLRAAGRVDLATEIDDVLVGRDVIPGYWTFQLVEAYDDNYWSVFRAVEERIRRAAGDAERHIFEAEMKVAEQTSGTSTQ
jgi:hypothetical protein